eukprot:4750350-Prymnesium_polylepis.1
MSLRVAVGLSLSFFLVALIGLYVLLPSTHDDAQTTGAALVALAQQQEKGILPPPRRAALPRCPEEGSLAPPPEPGPRENCLLEVHNRQTINVELLYVMPEGGEKRYWIVDYNSTFDINTFSGDQWRLRSRHGALLKDFAVPPCKALPGRRFVAALE